MVDDCTVESPRAESRSCTNTNWLITVTWVPNGESGAQPTKPSAQNQSTHAGPQTWPGTQTHPTGRRAQRP